MAFQFPSQAWIKALGKQLNQNDAYKRSAKDWEGNFIFIVESDQAYDEEAYLFLGLYHGESTGADQLESIDDRDVEYRISAPYSTWRKVIEGKLDPIQGMMTKQLRLEGDLMKIMRYPKAAQEIVASCAEIPTEW